jgi:hypothetical protein
VDVGGDVKVFACRTNDGVDGTTPYVQGSSNDERVTDKHLSVYSTKFTGEILLLRSKFCLKNPNQSVSTMVQ